MKKALGIIILLILVGLYFWSDLFDSEEASILSDKEIIQSETSLTSSKDSHQTTPEIMQEVNTVEPTIPLIEQRFRDSTDFYAFALEILEAAKNGDGESQYYLFKVLDKCRWIFESERELTSIAQGLPILYSRIIEPTRTLCAGFDKDNLTLFNLSEKRMDSYRIKMQWVSMSAENGYAPAVINDWFDNRRSYGYDETIAKMRGVLESKHPDVYHFLSLMPNKEKHQKYAWQFLACDYGYDCSTTSLEFWKYDSLIDCNPINSSHRVCSEELDYLNTIKESLSEEELEKSLETKEWLKEMIESGQVEKIINS